MRLRRETGDFQIVGISAGGTTTFNTIPKGLSIDDLVGAVIKTVYRSDGAADSVSNAVVVSATDNGDKILLMPGGANTSFRYDPATGTITM